MPGLILHTGAVMTCAHQGPANVPAPAQQRVLVGTQPVATTADTFVVSGCLFPGVSLGAPPCTTVRWTQTSTRVLVNGLPVLLQPAPPPSCGAGIGVGPPPSPPMVQAMQLRVWGT